MTTPDWLSKRGGELRPGHDNLAWLVFFAGEPNYLLEPLPAAGQHTCRVVQTNNGQRIDCGIFPSREGALQGGLDALRQTLGW